jgi:hypothetical protein
VCSAFIILRIMGKSIGQSVAKQFIDTNDQKYKNLSWLFMSQGRIAIVMAISFYEFFPSDWSMVILVLSVFSVLVNEYRGLNSYRNLLIDQEEIIPEESS